MGISSYSEKNGLQPFLFRKYDKKIQKRNRSLYTCFKSVSYSVSEMIRPAPFRSRRGFRLARLSLAIESFFLEIFPCSSSDINSASGVQKLADWSAIAVRHLLWSNPLSLWPHSVHVATFLLLTSISPSGSAPPHCEHRAHSDLSLR